MGKNNKTSLSLSQKMAGMFDINRFNTKTRQTNKKPAKTFSEKILKEITSVMNYLIKVFTYEC